MLYNGLSLSYSVKCLAFFVVLTFAAFGQSFDPNTGELVVDAPDTTLHLGNGTIPIFDPLTGEIISPIPEPTGYDQVNPIIPAYDPETGLPIKANAAVDLCVRAKTDAINATSGMWYLGGVGYFTGIPIYLLTSPKPSVESIEKMNTKDTITYVDCYKKAGKMERLRRMGSGCGMYLILALVLTGI